MSLPNFFVIGAPKAGTTALYECLKQHAEIFMSPVKEPGFFAFDSVPPINAGPVGTYLRRTVIFQPHDYYLLFANVTRQRAIGEATTFYLRSPLAAARIYRTMPHARLIAILRQPAERAYSDYLFFRFNHNVEPAPGFAQALTSEDSRREANWFPGYFYRANGYYYAQLRAYFDFFPREQIKIYLYEDWKSTPQTVLRDIFRFLEVDENFAPVVKRSNVTQYPRIHALHRLIAPPGRMERRFLLLPDSARRKIVSIVEAWDRKYNLIPPPSLDPEIRRQLTEGYREDILKLQDLIGRDLAHWL